MFSSNSRTIVFKIFIMPNFEYCSSLFTHNDHNSILTKLNKAFAKSLKRLLKINIDNLDITSTYNLLIKYNILPLLIRQLYHFSSFLYIVLNNNKLELNEKINSNKTSRLLRSKYTLPYFRSNVKSAFCELLLWNLRVIVSKILTFWNLGGFTDHPETIFFLFPIESYHICHIFSSLARFLVKILEF